MKVEIINHIEFGNKKDIVVTGFSLVGETPEERALINVVYGLKNKRVATAHNRLEITFTRTVENSY